MTLGLVTLALSFVGIFVVRRYSARWYLLALGCYQIPVWWAWEYERTSYANVYYGATAFLVGFEMWLALDVYRQCRTKILTFLLALLVPAALAWVACRHCETFADFETVAESVFLVFCAILVGQSATSLEQPMVYATFAVAWLAQAAFGLGYMLHIGRAEWYALNSFLPALINIAALGWIIWHSTYSAKVLKDELRKLPTNSTN
jgi:hypothetical protein